MALDVLAVGAHPDDIEIFCGGTLAKFVGAGARVGVLHLTRGELGSRGTPEQRADEARAAAAVLGAAEVGILDLGDGDLQDDARSRGGVVAWIRQHRPKLLIAPLPSDDHPDHARCGAIVKAAWYLSGIRKYSNEAKSEPHRPHHLWFYPSHEHLPPSFLVQLLAHEVEVKMRSIACYRSQFDETLPGEPRTRISDPRFMVALRARMMHYGALVDAEAAEPFVTPKPLGLSDLRSFVTRDDA